MTPSIVRELLEITPAGKHLIGCAFPGDPGNNNSTNWSPICLTPRSLLFLGEGNCSQNLYLSVSCFSKPVRQKAAFFGLLAVMVDDVGTEIAEGDVPLQPSWKILTSPGNWQYWYLLKEPLQVQAQADNLIKALQMKLSPDKDPGMLGVTRVGRPNCGINGKPKYRRGGEPFRVTGERVSGERFTPAAICEAFGLDPDVALSNRATSQGGGTGAAVQDDETLAFAVGVDPLGRWLDEQGLLKGGRNGNWVNITCPWVDGHTGCEDTGTAWMPADLSDSMHGAFKCHHGSCAERGIAEVEEYARAEGWAGRGLEEEEEEPPAERDPFDGYFYIASQDAFYDEPTRTMLSGAAFNRVHHQGVLDYVEDESGKVKQRRLAASKWFVANRQPYHDLTWDPREPRAVDVGSGRFNCNTWVKPDIKPSPEVPGPWLRLLKLLYPVEEDWRHIMQWLAFTLQTPERKINHILVLGGGQGVGKDTLLQPLTKIPHYSKTSPIGVVSGEFQEWFWAAKLVLLSEAKRETGRDAKDLHNALKQYAAAPPDTLLLNRKGRPRQDLPNVANILITTNLKDALHLERDDRRYYVTWTPLVAAEVYHEIKALWRFYEEEDGLAKVRGWLAGLDLSGFSWNDAPRQTEAFNEMMAAGVSHWAVAMAELLDESQAEACQDLLQRLQQSESGLNWTLRRVSMTLEELGWAKLKNPTNKRGHWRLHQKGRDIILAVYAHPRNQEAAEQAEAFVKGKRRGDFEVIDGGKDDDGDKDGDE